MSSKHLIFSQTAMFILEASKELMKVRKELVEGSCTSHWLLTKEEEITKQLHKLLSGSVESANRIDMEDHGWEEVEDEEYYEPDEDCPKCLGFGEIVIDNDDDGTSSYLKCECTKKEES